jgi:hypothetical protein
VRGGSAQRASVSHERRQAARCGRRQVVRRRAIGSRSCIHRKQQSRRRYRLPCKPAACSSVLLRHRLLPESEHCGGVGAPGWRTRVPRARPLRPHLRHGGLPRRPAAADPAAGGARPADRARHGRQAPATDRSREDSRRRPAQEFGGRVVRVVAGKVRGSQAIRTIELGASPPQPKRTPPDLARKPYRFTEATGWRPRQPAIVIRPSPKDGRPISRRRARFVAELERPSTSSSPSARRE